MQNPCEYRKTVWASTGKTSNKCEYEKNHRIRASSEKWQNPCEYRKFVGAGTRKESNKCEHRKMILLERLSEKG